MFCDLTKISQHVMDSNIISYLDVNANDSLDPRMAACAKARCVSVSPPENTSALTTAAPSAASTSSHPIHGHQINALIQAFRQGLLAHPLLEVQLRQPRKPRVQN